jgi:coenzyme F420-reducing hydrogenase delta subunit
MTGFEPKIIAFLCRWCAYEGADAAGRKRLEIPPNLGVVRVPCSGRVDPMVILRALHAGADGVMVLACHPGDCHYGEGNSRARHRFTLLQRMLAPFGVGEQRLVFGHVSATEAEGFARCASAMVERVRELGPRDPRREAHGQT